MGTFGQRKVVHGTAAVLAVAAAIAACSSSEGSAAVDRARLADKCFIDSDCDATLICAFQRCHIACTTSRDCVAISPTARCVISSRPSNVCQLEAEQKCSYNSQCSSGQLCAIDEQCRDQCRTDKDCVSGQKCATGSCAEPTELRADGSLAPVSDASTTDGQPCSYNSDCTFPLSCRNGTCAFQCKTDRDCDRREVCTGNLCTPVPPDAGACAPVICGVGGKDCGVLPDGCGGVANCSTNPAGKPDCTPGETCGGAGPNVCGSSSCTPVTCPLTGKNCGVLSDGCSAVLQCGVCPAGQICGGGGVANVCGCTPNNAAACAGKDCGPAVNNCGQSVDCGKCSAPLTCGAGGASNKCGCVKATCAALGKTCGDIPDGCGGKLSCPSVCGGGQTCGGAGTPNVCGSGMCTKLSCPAQLKDCGLVTDGCNGVLDCGNCTQPNQTCGGAGVSNTCGCSPMTCAALGKNCGSALDGCGTLLQCGDCGSSQSCGGGGTPGQCGCTPTTCVAAGKNCGAMNDGCGNIVACGACPSGQSCGAGGIPNTCAPPGAAKSCQGSLLRCGPTSTDDCCATATVLGGVFNRQHTASDPTQRFPAKVSSFKLDLYEVTVSRFRSFVTAAGTWAFQSTPPPAGAGANTSIPVGTNTGWDLSWNTHLTTSLADMDAKLKVCVSPRWTTTAQQQETFAIDCLTWYDAFAFCAWDGGRLPTENELQYAAGGGTEYRYYPWSAPPTDQTRTCSYDDNGCGGPFAAGSQPLGAGRWGQRNLVGGVREWTLDAWKTPYRYQDCSLADCTDMVAGASRIVRSGDTSYAAAPMLEDRSWRLPDQRTTNLGVRCARNP